MIIKNFLLFYMQYWISRAIWDWNITLVSAHEYFGQNDTTVHIQYLTFCSSRPEELVHIVDVTKFCNKPCEVDQYVLPAVNDSYSSKRLGCFAREFLQADYRFSEYSKFSSSLQYIIFETLFFSQPD